MAQTKPEKLAQTSHLALEQYSHSNLPIVPSRKDVSDAKLIRSEFTPAIDTRQKHNPPTSSQLRNALPVPPPPPIKTSNSSSNQNMLFQQPVQPPAYNQQIPPPFPAYSQPIPLPPKHLEGAPYLPGDYKFYSSVKQAVPQNYPRSGFEKLMMGNALTMRPIFDLDEKGASLMKTLSTFYIYPGIHSREQYSMEPMFVVRESTNSCAKACLTTDCRPFEVLISHDFEGKQEFLHLSRDCNVNCFCMGRPEMAVEYCEEGSAHPFDFGGIFHPFVCCEYELEAFNNTGQTMFVITAQRCACNIYCCFGCDSCNHSNFTIKDMYNNEVGSIEIGTHYQSCLPGANECDYFTINFAPFLGPPQRVLLVSAMIFISTRLFSRGIGPQVNLE